jgi:hypothetical protein
MPIPGTYRNLRSVMLVTLHVAAIASLLRYFQGSRLHDGSLLVWVPLTVAIATLISWPINRAFLAEFHDRGDSGRICPRCRRDDLRPLIRPGDGIFQPAVGYRCAGCRTTIRWLGESKTIEIPPPADRPVSRSGIRFLDEPDESFEIRFLDDPPETPARG